MNFCRPQSLLNGMNRFLESLEITFRRDPNNLRPRINKMCSVKVRANELKGELVIHFQTRNSKRLDFIYFLQLANDLNFHCCSHTECSVDCVLV